MTHLAQDSPSALPRLCPVLLWQVARIHSVVYEKRSGHALKHVSGSTGQGRESPIVAHHKAAITPPDGNF